MSLKFLGGLLRFIMVFRVIQHGCAHTVLPLLAHQDIIVDTAFAARPERIVLGQLGIGHRLITQVRVDLHDGKPRCQTKDLCVRIGCPAEPEDLAFDLFGKPAFAEGGCDDKAGIGDIFAVAPGLDIAEPGPDTVFCEGNDGFTLPHLLLDIVRAPFGNTGASRQGRRLHFVTDDLSEVLVGYVSYQYFELLLFHDFNDALRMNIFPSMPYEVQWRDGDLWRQKGAM